AAAVLELAIDADEDYLPAYVALIPLWIDSGQLDVLERQLERATARHPDFAAGWYGLAFAYRSQGRHAIAVLAYRTYIALRPADPAPWYGYAMSLLRTDDRERAREALRRYLQLEHDPAMAGFVDQARHQLAILDGTAPDPARALADAGRAIGAALHLHELPADLSTFQALLGR
ncbi:MAG TPA: tetratricopeptide repeat protein, partial [Kofleriaceae bacterium]|nr:tetratricopeptide repeat protein [Kofleriaceae bacterium]